jgi:aldehyde:ferredoxin oxidoreductase
VADALGVCLFICSSLTAVSMSDFAQAFAEVTGWQADEDELWHAGRRIVSLERMINLDCGLGPQDDSLPERFREEPLPEGMAAGNTVVELDRMVADYYHLRGWDAQGVPTSASLKALGLEWRGK